MKLSVTREPPGENRVAAVPKTVEELRRLGFEVFVESSAGAGSLVADADYSAAGAQVVATADEAMRGADVAVKVGSIRREDGRDELAMLKGGAVFVGMVSPFASAAVLAEMAKRGVTVFAMDLVPRIARAQAMDPLSSQASIAGYRAVMLAATGIKKMMPMMMTAAGTIHPSAAVVIGAGVAGLEAVAMLRKLGATVKAIDTRPAVKEQVESLGARFIPLEVAHEKAETAGGYAADLGEEFYRKEQEIIAPHVRGADIVICTAQIPSRRAPLLVTEAMLGEMSPGGVLVDLAAPTGGNCTATRGGQTVAVGSVQVIGPLNLPSELPVHASAMYARNVLAFLREIVRDGKVVIDKGNEVVRAMLVTHEGAIVNEQVKAAADRAAGAKETGQ